MPRPGRQGAAPNARRRRRAACRGTPGIAPNAAAQRPRRDVSLAFVDAKLYGLPLRSGVREHMRQGQNAFTHIVIYAYSDF